MHLKGTGYQNFVQWRVLTNAVMNQFPYETGVFLDQLSDYQLLKNSSAMSRWTLGGKASKPEATPPQLSLLLRLKMPRAVLP
jgi:hypothetical protein